MLSVSAGPPQAQVALGFSHGRCSRRRHPTHDIRRYARHPFCGRVRRNVRRTGLLERACWIAKLRAGRALGVPTCFIRASPSSEDERCRLRLRSAEPVREYAASKGGRISLPTACPIPQPPRAHLIYTHPQYPLRGSSPFASAISYAKVAVFVHTFPPISSRNKNIG
jgi:hypothetical protein